MTTDERLDRLESRLSNSERQVGRYRKATMLMGVLLLAGVVMGQTARDGRFKEVRCESLSVIAEDGTKEVHLGGPTMFWWCTGKLGHAWWYKSRLGYFTVGR